MIIKNLYKFYFITLILIVVYISIKKNINNHEKYTRKKNRVLYIEPYGRFGNNIIQLTNGINLGLQTRCTKIIFNDYIIDLPKYNNININDINYNFITKINDDGQNYYYIDKLQNIYPEYNPSLVNQGDVRNLLLHYCFKKYNFIHSEYLCIHIRSGDIFSNRPHHLYIQPPYEFYKIILQNFKDKPVILIAEDKKNPVINKLLQNYSNIFWKKNTLKRDQEIIMNAKYVIYGLGTFVNQLLFLSYGKKKTINFEKDKIIFNEYDNGFVKQIQKVKVNNYIDYWKNTKIQRYIMLNFKLKENCDINNLEKLIYNFTN